MVATLAAQQFPVETLAVGETFRQGVLTAVVATPPIRQRRFGRTETYWAWTATVVAVAPAAVQRYESSPVGTVQRFTDLPLFGAVELVK